jgi:hypothetical protein
MLRLVVMLAMVLMLALAASAAPAADLFGWFREDGTMTLRSEASHEVLGRISPGLFGPGWTGFEATTAEGSPREIAAGRWQYSGSMVPEGQAGSVDYTVTATRIAGGVEVSYQFTTRGELSLNALYIRLKLPLSFANGGRALLPGKEVAFPAAYLGRPGMHFGPGKEIELRLSTTKMRLSVEEAADIELQDNREWKEEAFDLSFHVFHGDQARTVPTGSGFRQTLRVEVEGMRKVVNEPTIRSKTDTSGWFPFDLPPDVPKKGEAGFEGAVDFSDTIERPAGEHGFVKAEGEHFAFEDGTPVKFWGVNLDSGGGLPEKAHAPTAARRMAQLGINIARFTVDHAAPKGIIAQGNDTRHIDAEMLDRLDYFVACLKENGVYTRLDLMHYRVYQPGDGVDAPTERGEESPYGGGPAMYFDPKAEELHQEFTRQLLLHENPYTKLRYVDDPAVVFIGIVNENTIFFYPGRMTESGRKKLDARYDEWVKANPGGSKLQFLAETERRYYERMYSFLREIGVKTPIAGHNMVMNAADGELLAQVGDHIEFNTYWDHPHKDYRWTWNKPMVKDQGGIFKAMSAATAAGRPFAITEINFCGISYKMEAPLMTLAYASLQDWDAVLWWDYNANWQKAGGFEDFSSSAAMFTSRDNPMMMAQFGAASLAFRKGYISPAKTRIDVKLSHEETLGDNWVWGNSWSDLKANSPFAALPLMSRVRTRFDNMPTAPRADIVLQTLPADPSEANVISVPDAVRKVESDPNLAWRLVREKMRALKLGELPEPGATTFPSDTGELSWDTKEGVLSMTSPRFQGAVGFIGGRRLALGDFTLEMAKRPEFSAVSLCPLDGRPLKESKRILLTLAGRAEDTGQSWEEGSEGDFAATSGERPVLAEPVRGRLTWEGRTLKVFALSASGKRVEEVGSGEALEFGGDQTMWYELVPAGAPGAKSTLAAQYGGSNLGSVISPLSKYHPFPTVEERQPWGKLPAETRKAAIAGGEEYLNYAWPVLPASLYMEFSRDGNRSRYEGPYFARRSALSRLVLAECVEGKGRFLDDIINGIWAICEESSWVIPAHNQRGQALNDTSGDWIDLFAAETGDLLAWTHYLLGSRLEAVDPLVTDRMRREVKSRILDPFLTHNDYWWMGVGGEGRLNNWSPWCSSNVLASFLLLDPDQERRTEATRKVLGILDRFLAGYHSDGACDEGPSYWTVAGASLLDCLELLRGASGGKIDIYDRPLVQEMGRYVYRAQISGDYYIDFADSPARVHMPSGLLYRYGRRINDSRLMTLGSWEYQRYRERGLLWGSLLRVLPDAFDSAGIEAPAEPPYPRDVWLEGTQIMAAREREGSDRGIYLAAKGGHNAESHNHNDVGTFIVYLDGQPVLVDAGVGTYTKQTFSDQRYEIWTMQSAYHNLPTANGVQQQEGEEFRASDLEYRADDRSAELSMDIAKAYPAKSGITSWRRTYRLLREEGAVEVTEDFKLTKPTADIALSLVTPCRPTPAGPGKITLASAAGPVSLSFDEALTPMVETIPLEDDSLRSSWGETMYRVVLKPATATAQGKWTVRVGK